MPTFEYKCLKCDRIEEVIQTPQERDNNKAEYCSICASKMEKLVIQKFIGIDGHTLLPPTRRNITSYPGGTTKKGERKPPKRKGWS